MNIFPSLQLLWKFSDLRDEATRAIALLPQITAALDEPLVYRKLELFAPISSEVFLILASGIKDLDPTLSFAACGDDDECMAVCAAMGIDFKKLKEFFIKVAELAKEIAPYLIPVLFLDDGE